MYFLSLSSQISFKIPRTNTEEGSQWPVEGSPEQGTTVLSWEKPSPICSPFSSEATTPPSPSRRATQQEETQQKETGRDGPFSLKRSEEGVKHSWRLLGNQTILDGGRTLRVVLYFKHQWERSKASCWKGAHGAMRRLDRCPQGHGLAKKPWEALRTRSISGVGTENIYIFFPFWKCSSNTSLLLNEPALWCEKQRPAARRVLAVACWPLVARKEPPALALPGFTVTSVRRGNGDWGLWWMS